MAFSYAIKEALSFFCRFCYNNCGQLRENAKIKGFVATILIEYIIEVNL